MTIWKQMNSGRVLDLAPFNGEAIDLHGDIAESLAKLCRFDGHVPGGVYSVAQHCVLMADAALEETADANIAAHCLLHDAHEAVIGDITTPVVLWLDAIARMASDDMDGPRPIPPSTLINRMKDEIDAAIWRAAGIPAPGATWRAVVKDFDRRMLATEKRQLLNPARRSWGEAVETARPIRMRGRISIWPFAKAADEWRARLSMFCPNARVLS